VQLAGVPSPITRSGREVSTARASAGTSALPSGLPAPGSGAGGLVVGGSVAGLVGGPLADAGPAGASVARVVDRGAAWLLAVSPTSEPPDDEHPDSASSAATRLPHAPQRRCMGGP
jgi:hypothetical protein